MRFFITTPDPDAMKRYILLVFFLISWIQVDAQDSLRRPKFSAYGSAGINLYLNNFDYFKKFVNPVHYNFSLRLMWEPASRVSIGLKTGYYRIYTVDFNGPNNGKFSLSAIPIQTFFTMTLYKGVYALFGMGPSLYFNNISTSKGEVLNASFYSLADISAGFGYIQKPRNSFSFGAEFEYFYSSKSNENLLSLSFIARLPL
ncbi:hypothetical protein BH10BAC4_BH10BAC4_19380 [soil metagenome]